MITAKSVADLREITGCGMMDCKKALVETDGDIDKAVEYLREKGLAAVAKKAGRIAAEGLVHAHIDGGVGVVVEINSETDFVGKNEGFKAFVKDVAEHVGKLNPKTVEELMEQDFQADKGKTVRDALNEKIIVIGENLNIRRFERYEGVVESYVHGGGRIGVLVLFKLGDDSAKVKPEFKEFAKDIAMQVAAASPQFVQRSEVPSAQIEKEKEILRAQALNEGKPEAIVDKMVVGRVDKYYKEICILEQPYIKDPDVSVSQHIKDTEKVVGTSIELVKFARFEKGEGLQKREDDFAAEVAKMSQK